jgi:hypothetical protein
MGTDFWAALGTSVATLIFLIPALVYAYYVLDGWIGDPDGYARVVAAVESSQKRTPSIG